MKRILFLSIFLILLAVAIYFAQVKSVGSFEECVKAGYPVMETYPPQCKTPDGKSFTQQQSPTVTKTFTGDKVTFQHPSQWNPKEGEEKMGSIGQTIYLGIPEIESDQEMGFSAVPLSEINTNDISRQEQFIIKGQQWIKWIRKGEGYTSYDYYAQKGDDNPFGIHVTVGEENKELENQLDNVVRSLIFK